MVLSSSAGGGNWRKLPSFLSFFLLGVLSLDGGFPWGKVAVGWGQHMRPGGRAPGVFSWCLGRFLGLGWVCKPHIFLFLTWGGLPCCCHLQTCKYPLYEGTPKGCGAGGWMGLSWVSLWCCCGAGADLEKGVMLWSWGRWVQHPCAGPGVGGVEAGAVLGFQPQVLSRPQLKAHGEGGLWESFR